MPPHDRVYLEPHLDDAVLSCGGTIALQVGGGERVLVVTVFAGSPGTDAEVTPFAAMQHERWGERADPIALRRAEQREALGLLGADWRPLDFLDAIYRGDQYLSDEDLFGPVKAGDAAVAADIAERVDELLREHAGARVYAPLTLGNHVDHQLVRRAAEAATARAPFASSLLLYEDFPYAARVGGELRGESDRVPIEATLDRKIAAIGCYRSQIPTLFGDADRMAAATREYSERVGGGTPAERFWTRVVQQP